jgi:hypothetical protein
MPDAKHGPPITAKDMKEAAVFHKRLSASITRPKISRIPEIRIFRGIDIPLSLRYSVGFQNFA